jgi:predicted flavoprotein YhiN
MPRRRSFPLRQPAFLQVGARAFHAADFIAMVDRHGIAWHEKTLGQLFCDDSAKDIIRMLLAEMKARRALHLRHRDGRRREKRDGFRISTRKAL